MRTRQLGQQGLKVSNWLGCMAVRFLFEQQCHERRVSNSSIARCAGRDFSGHADVYGPHTTKSRWARHYGQA